MAVDTIFVRAIRLSASVGTHSWERRTLQPLEVDIDAEVDTTQLLATGSLKHGVDYSVMIRTVKRVVLHDHVELLEVLADRIALELLSDTPASRIRVEIRKYGACTGEANHVGVVVRRERPSVGS